MASGLTILGLTGVSACRSCGERAKAERDRLQSESDKLRELAKEATNVAHELCSEYSAPCSSCVVKRCDTGCKLDWIDKLACELGIEVE